ncbi:MAG TPA: DUF2993 domain-containing protein [Actinopolymorphaceae bacterium]|jgi:hypothetical protein
MRRLIIVLFVLGLMFVVVDRVAVVAVQREMAARAQTGAGLNARPDVVIRGFPFLTQAIRGRYDHIEVSLGDVSRGDIELRDVRLELHDVRAPLSSLLDQNRQLQPQAQTVQAFAVVPYAVVTRSLPHTVLQVRDVRPQGESLQLTGELTLAGLPTIPISATLDISALADAIAIRPSQVDAGPLPSLPVHRALTITVPVDLPAGFELSGVRVTRTGLQITGHGRDIVLARVR